MRVDGPIDLGDGLVLRSGRPGDEGAIIEHVVAAFAPTVEQRLRSQLADGVRRWLGVWRGGRLVSSSALLDHTLAVDGVALPVGQIEWVVTDPGYQRRGLVRRQQAVHHPRATEAGAALTIVDGIPYVYRHLGWGYALSWPRVVGLAGASRAMPASDTATWHEGIAVRPALEGDQRALAALDDLRPAASVHVVRSPARWSWWIELTGRGPDEQVLVAERDGDLDGWARIERDGAAAVVLVRPGPTRTATAAAALLERARAGAAPGWTVEVAERPGPWQAVLASAEHLPYDHGVQARACDPAALVRSLVPALDRRLAQAGREETGTIDLSLYATTVRLELVDGRIASVGRGPRIEDPFVHGDVGIAPDLLPALVLGRFGARGLARRADDVTLGRHEALIQVLFPALPADVVTDL